MTRTTWGPGYLKVQPHHHSCSYHRMEGEPEICDCGAYWKHPFTWPRAILAIALGFLALVAILGYQP